MVSDRRLLIRTPLINVITRSIYNSIKHTMRDFREADELINTQKGPISFVRTCADKIQDVLVEELMQARPRFGLKIVGEAITIGQDPEQFWVINPLAGFRNFHHGVNSTAITVALELQDQVLAGVVYDPLHDEMFYAENGQGAFVNDRRLSLARGSNLKDMIVGFTPFESAQDPKDYLLKMGHLKGHVGGFRISGCAALDMAYAAAGRLDALVFQGADISDTAAGVILLKEAGAVSLTKQAPSLTGMNGVWGSKMAIDQIQKLLG